MFGICVINVLLCHRPSASASGSALSTAVWIICEQWSARTEAHYGYFFSGPLPRPPHSDNMPPLVRYKQAPLHLWMHTLKPSFVCQAIHCIITVSSSHGISGEAGEDVRGHSLSPHLKFTETLEDQASARVCCEEVSLWLVCVMCFKGFGRHTMGRTELLSRRCN